MTSCAQPICHPWFNPSPLKRKLSNTDDERRPTSPYQRLSPSPPCRAKRRKFNTLEHGFAHLTLASAAVHSDLGSGPSITPIVHPTASFSSSEESVALPPGGIVFPGSVEEPPHEIEATSLEVSMECEDEREYISDIPMASADLNKHTSHKEASRFTISTPFLERLRTHQAAPQNVIPISSPSTDAGALVLYRPLRPLSPHRKVDEEAESIEEVVTPWAATLLESLSSGSDNVVDDEAMDIE